jgi:hypothetical protein
VGRNSTEENVAIEAPEPSRSVTHHEADLARWCNALWNTHTAHGWAHEPSYDHPFEQRLRASPEGTRVACRVTLWKVNEALAGDREVNWQPGLRRYRGVLVEVEWTRVELDSLDPPRPPAHADWHLAYSAELSGEAVRLGYALVETTGKGGSVRGGLSEVYRRAQLSPTERMALDLWLTGESIRQVALEMRRRKETVQAAIRSGLEAIVEALIDPEFGGHASWNISAALRNGHPADERRPIESLDGLRSPYGGDVSLPRGRRYPHKLTSPAMRASRGV